MTVDIEAIEHRIAERKRNAYCTDGGFGVMPISVRTMEQLLGEVKELRTQVCKGCAVQEGYVPVEALSATIKEPIDALIERFRSLPADHKPDGWPAVQTKEITALLDHIAELKSQLEAIGAGGVEPLRKPTKPMARYCPECGHVGEIGAEHRDCCPDGSSAFMVPAKWANELRAGFKAQLAAVQQAALEPFGYVNTHTGQFFKDVEPCRKNNEGHWRTVYTYPTQQGLDAQRWQIVHNRISGEYIAGRAHFVVQLPPVPDTNIMRGSVAEHFTKAVDFAVAQAKKGDV